MREMTGDRALGWALFAVTGLTLLRLYVVGTSDLNLNGDEAQYWSWSKEPAFGYFSKPPLIAWLIGGFTAVCGDGEACIRAASPLLYAATSMLVFVAALTLYTPRVAMWSAIVFATMPGVSFSSALMTTDVPLLTFWAGALVCLARMLRRAPRQARIESIAMGLCLGLAILSKYAGTYFFLGLAVAALIDRRVRRHVFSLNGLIVLFLAGLLVTPNALWNVDNGFATVVHTADNAALGGRLFHPNRMLEFAGAQFGVFGPILLGTIIAGLVCALRRESWPRANEDDRVLVAMGLPVLLAGLTIGLLSRANANWAAPAYVSLAIVATAWLTRGVSIRWLQVSTAFAAIVAAILYTAALSPAFVEAIGLTNAFKSVRGWEVQGPAIARAAQENAIGTILLEDRMEMASLLFYTRGTGLALRMWTPDPARPDDHFQMTRPFTGEPASVLFVTQRDDPADVLAKFERAEKIEIVSTTVAKDSKGADRKRVFNVYVLTARRGA